MGHQIRISATAILMGIAAMVLLSGCAHKPTRYLERGLASWYGPRFHGRQTANGERFDMYKMTAAHKTLPMGSVVLVKSTRTHKTVVVRINDRGPYGRGRVIDLSFKAAKELGILEKGMEEVEIFLQSSPTHLSAGAL